MTRIKSLMLIALISCNMRNNKPEEHLIRPVQVSTDSARKLSAIWKSDTVGCRYDRKYDQVVILINTFTLIGKDSVKVVNVLGSPNYVSRGRDGVTIFIYFMSCGKSGSTSYNNFYCYFRDGVLRWYDKAVF